jgi:uncharacterized protein (TIGR00255 family)
VMCSARPSATIRSMTGFSRVSFGSNGVEVHIEVRSVNHRFLDVVVKSPRCYGPYEREIRSILQRIHRRGRIEISLSRKVAAGSVASDELPPSLDRYMRMYGAACSRYGVSADTVGSFLGQLIARESSLDQEAEVSEAEVVKLLEGVEEASEALAVMRESEGSGLTSDVGGRLRALESICHAIKGIAAKVSDKARDRLVERIRALEPEVTLDEQRLVAEVALISERTDISEELSRLGIHIAAFSKALAGSPDGVGRKLDFLSQEIGRELNTIGSKAQDAAVQGHVVEGKTELERIREQVQNIE